MSRFEKSFVLTLCCILLGYGTLSAQSQTEYNPDSPSEPAVLDYCYLIVSADPAEGAYVGGGGKYTIGKGNVYLSTSARNDRYNTYTFQYWTIDGEILSYSQYFWFTPKKGRYQVVAHYSHQEIGFDPTNPSEPSASNIKKKYHLYLSSNLAGACTFNIASGDKHDETSSVYLHANANPYYQFECWKVNGVKVSDYTGFYYTMPSHDVTVQAVFTELEYNPDSPMDPSGSGQTNIDVNTDPDRKLINLTIGNGQTQSDKTRIVLNDKKSLDYETSCDAAKFTSATADYQIYSIDSKDVKYSINERPVDNGSIPLGIMVKTAGTVQIAADRMDCSAILIDKSLKIEHDLSDGPYSFNSTAGTFEERFELYIPVAYILGDANGDGEINVSDFTAIASKIMGNPPASFVEKAADVNKDSEINVGDLTAVANIILHGSL